MILTQEELINKCKEDKKYSKKIVFTNGCFDILHIGHARYLQQAATLGDILVVGVNSDSSVKKLKGENRPIVPEGERAELISMLKPVSYVCIFDEETPLNLIKAVSPDVLVKGGDYSPTATHGKTYIVGKEFAKSVQVINFVEGKSTTNIIEKILELVK